MAKVLVKRHSTVIHYFDQYGQLKAKDLNDVLFLSFLPLTETSKGKITHCDVLDTFIRFLVER